MPSVGAATWACLLRVTVQAVLQSTGGVTAGAEGCAACVAALLELPVGQVRQQVLLAGQRAGGRHRQCSAFRRLPPALCCAMCPAALLTCPKMSLLRRHTACGVLSTGQRHRLLHQGAAGQGQVRQGALAAADARVCVGRQRAALACPGHSGSMAVFADCAGAGAHGQRPVLRRAVKGGWVLAAACAGLLVDHTADTRTRHPEVDTSVGRGIALPA